MLTLGPPPSTKPTLRGAGGLEFTASNRPEHMHQGLAWGTAGSVSAVTVTPHQSLKVIVETAGLSTNQLCDAG